MLQAFLKNKLKDSSFEPSEDSLTSSVFGLMQYLPAQTMWNLLRESCVDKSSLVEISGDLREIDFWPNWVAKGKDISNERFVEPDVFCEFENFDLIVEAKRGDHQSKQSEYQWINEINAYMNEYPDRKKPLIFFAIGGIKTFKTQIITVRSGKQAVFSVSWQNLLNTVYKHKKECSNHELRILSDIIQTCEKHGVYSMEWLKILVQYIDNMENKNKEMNNELQEFIKSELVLTGTHLENYNKLISSKEKINKQFELLIKQVAEEIPMEIISQWKNTLKCDYLDYTPIDEEQEAGIIIEKYGIKIRAYLSIINYQPHCYVFMEKGEILPQALEKKLRKELLPSKEKGKIWQSWGEHEYDKAYPALKEVINILIA